MLYCMVEAWRLQFNVVLRTNSRNYQDSHIVNVSQNIRCEVFYYVCNKCLQLDKAACYVTCLNTIFHPWVAHLFFLEQPKYESISIEFSEHSENITCRVEAFLFSPANSCDVMSCHALSYHIISCQRELDGWVHKSGLTHQSLVCSPEPTVVLCML